MTDRALVFATGGSAAFSATALWEFLRRMDWISAATLVGSILSTVVSYIIVWRAKLAQSEIERQHQLRQAARDEDIADLLTRLRIQEADRAAARPPAPP